MGEEVDLLVNSTLVAEAWTNAHLAMLIVDEEGRYVGTNKEARQLTGYSHSELTALRAGHDLAGDDRSTRIYRDLERGSRMQGKKVVRRKDGYTVNCRYWGIRTTIARLPYYILLLWPEPAAAAI